MMNKYLILPLLLIAQAASQNQYCPETGTVYLTHYSNCSLFFECDEGVKILMYCPEAFAWNPDDNDCGPEEDMDCSFTTLFPPSTTSAPDTRQCPLSGISYLPHLEDCTEYYECKNGEKILKECPRGQAWSIPLDACEFVQHVDCSYTTAAPSTTPQDLMVCPDKGSAYLPDYLNCSAFYDCRDGNKILRYCPEYYAWDINLEACDFEENVNCDYTTIYSPTTPTSSSPTASTYTSTSSSETSTIPESSTSITVSTATTATEPNTVTSTAASTTTRAPTITTTEAPATITTVAPATTSTAAPTTITTETTTSTTTAAPTTTTTEATTSATSEAPTTTPEPINYCEGQDSTYVPYPYDCEKYILCINNEGYIYNCPSETSWNQDKTTCDTNNDENCKYVSTTTVRTTTFRTTNPTSTTHVPTTISSTTASTSTTITTTIATTTVPANVCDGVADSTYVPDVDDCTKYIICVSGQEYIYSCPSGTSWNQDQTTCDTNNDINCNTTYNAAVAVLATTELASTAIAQSPAATDSTTGAPTASSEDTEFTSSEPDYEVCPANGVIYLPYYSNCSMFYECIDGVRILMHCPEDFGWSIEEDQCVPAEDSDCDFLTSTLSPGTTTTTPDDRKCPGTGIGYMPNLADCTEYYECREGERILKHCPAGQAWNPPLEACDFEKNVDCSYTTTEQSTTPNDNDKCPSTGVAYLPDYSNCASLYICLDGDKTLKQCPDGYAWDIIRELCDIEENVDCSYITSVTPTVTTEDITSVTHTVTTQVTTSASESTLFPTTSVPIPPPSGLCTNQPDGTFLEHPYDCTKYIECLGGVELVYPCKIGSTWDQSKQECNTNTDDNCKYISTPPSTLSPPSTASTTSSGTTPSPSDQCTGKPNGSFLPYIDDCTKFIVCETEQAIIYECATGMSWNVDKNACDTNNEENCKNDPTTAPTTVTTPRTRSTPTPHTRPTTKPTASTKPPIPPPSGLCTGQSDGTLITHPSDCTKYIECLGGLEIVYPCASGTSWNQDQQTCDTTNNEICGITSTSTTTPYTGSTSTSSPTTRPTGSTKPPVPPPSGLCKGQSDGTLIANPNDCTKYIECLGELEIVYPCASGTSWNQDKQICDITNNEQCISTPITSVTTEVTTPNTGSTSTSRPTTRPTGSTKPPVPPPSGLCTGQSDGTLIAHPNDCTKYIECLGGFEIVYPCASGTSWNQDKQTCDTTNNEKCDVTSTSATTPHTGPTTTTPNGSTTTPSSTTPGSTTKAPIPPPSDLCTNQPDGTYLEHPYDCTKYIECLGGVELVYPCKTGSTWDQSKQECNANNDDNCKYISTPPSTLSPPTTAFTTSSGTTPSPVNPCTGKPNGSFLPYTGDCTKFIICETEEVIVYECDTGTSWNTNKNACDDNNAENCKDSSTTANPTGPTTPTTPHSSTTSTSRPTTKPTGSTKPPVPPPSGLCTGQSDGTLITHPNDCTKYIECLGGLEIVYPCASGTSWNQDTQTCDTTNNENCGIISTSAMTTHTGSTPTNKPTTRPTGSTKAPVPPPNGLCTGQSDGSLVAHPNDCTKYIECLGGLEIVYPCGVGTSWNQDKQTCDTTNNENCNVVPTLITPATTAVTAPYTGSTSVPTRTTKPPVPPPSGLCTGQSDGTLLTHPYDCTKYIKCVGGVELVYPCSSGTSWNQNKQICDANNNKNCNGMSTPITPPTTAPTGSTITSSPGGTCAGKPSGSFLPYLPDCTLFIVCETEQEIIYECATGTSWNTNKNACDNNNAENCKNNSSTTAKPTGTTSKPTGTTSSSTGTTKTRPTGPTSPRTTIVPPDPNTCKGQTDGTFLPYPNSSDKYIECISGMPIVYPCPNGTSWSQSNQACNSNFGKIFSKHK